MDSTTNYTYKIESVDSASGTMKVSYTNTDTGETVLEPVRIPMRTQTIDEVVAAACPFLPHIIAAKATISDSVHILPAVGMSGSFATTTDGGVLKVAQDPTAGLINADPTKANTKLTPEEIAQILFMVKNTPTA